MCFYIGSVGLECIGKQHKWLTFINVHILHILVAERLDKNSYLIFASSFTYAFVDRMGEII